MAREMKDSGIQWVGIIPADWECRRLRFLCEIQTGNQDTQDSIPDGLFPFYVRSPIVERSNKYTFEGPAILMAGDGAGAGRVFHYVDGKYGCHQRGYSLQKITDINRRFLYYYLSNLFYREIEIANSKSTVDSVRLPMLQNFQVVFPNDHKQKKIVEHLDSKCAEIDAVLNKTRTSIEEYKKLKQAIITQAVTKGIRGDRPMKESGVIWLDTVPAEWTISKIKYTIFPKEKPVLPMDEVITCFRDGTVTLRRNRREEGFTISFTENGYQGVDVGDLVIHGMDTFAGAIGCSDSRGKTSPVVHVCSTVGNNRYFMYFLRYMAYSGVLMDFSNGVRIRSSDFRNFKKLAVFEMLVPPLREQNKIVDYLDSTLAKIDQVIKQKEILISELEACKKSAIYEYVTGKKEVPNAY